MSVTGLRPGPLSWKLFPNQVTVTTHTCFVGGKNYQEKFMCQSILLIDITAAADDSLHRPKSQEPPEPGSGSRRDMSFKNNNASADAETDGPKRCNYTCFQGVISPKTPSFDIMYTKEEKGDV